MRLRVVAVGRLKSGPERELAERYLARAGGLARALGFGGPEIAELPEGRAGSAPLRMDDEGRRVADKLDGAFAVLLDEAGPALGSEALASRLRALRDEGRTAAAFVIGGPDGTASALKTRADLLLSFGRMTLPHGLVRVLVLEQIYRALTIIAGHPYHRSGGEAA